MSFLAFLSALPNMLPQILCKRAGAGGRGRRRSRLPAELGLNP